MAGGAAESERDGAEGPDRTVLLQPTTEGDPAWRAPSVGWRPADDGVVLYDGSALGLHQLNGSAGLVWQLLDPEVPLQVTIDDVAAAVDASRDQVHDDVLGIVDALRLRELALIEGDPSATTAEPTLVEVPEPDDEDVEEPKYQGVPPNV